MEEENKEIKERKTKIQSKVSEIDRKEYIRKPHRSSESDEETPRKRKSSDSSSSDEENKEVNKEKIYAQQVLEKLREPEIIIKIADKKIDET
jgi:hypothetical protein